MNILKSVILTEKNETLYNCQQKEEIHLKLENYKNDFALIRGFPA